MQANVKREMQKIKDIGLDNIGFANIKRRVCGVKLYEGRHLRRWVEKRNKHLLRKQKGEKEIKNNK